MPASPPTARPSTFSALKERNSAFYWLGLVCYVLGHRAEYMTFAWLTWELTRDPRYLGFLGLAQGVPLVAFQLYGGVLADRADRVRLLLATQLGTAATLIAAFVLTVVGVVRVEYLLALAALSSVFRASRSVARIVGERSLATSSDTPAGRNARSAGSCAMMPSTVAMMLACGWRLTTSSTAGWSLKYPALYRSSTPSKTLATSCSRTGVSFRYAITSG